MTHVSEFSMTSSNGRTKVFLARHSGNGTNSDQKKKTEKAKVIYHRNYACRGKYSSSFGFATANFHKKRIAFHDVRQNDFAPAAIEVWENFLLPLGMQ